MFVETKQLGSLIELVWTSPHPSFVCCALTPWETAGLNENLSSTDIVSNTLPIVVPDKVRAQACQETLRELLEQKETIILTVEPLETPLKEASRDKTIYKTQFAKWLWGPFVEVLSETYRNKITSRYQTAPEDILEQYEMTKEDIWDALQEMQDILEKRLIVIADWTGIENPEEWVGLATVLSSAWTQDKLPWGMIAIFTQEQLEWLQNGDYDVRFDRTSLFRI